MFKEGDVVECTGDSYHNLTLGTKYKIFLNRLGCLVFKDDFNVTRFIDPEVDRFKLVSSAQSTLPKYIKWSEGSCLNYIKLSKVSYFNVINDYITVDVGQMSYRIVKDDVANFDEIKSILIKYFEEGL
jgi:hypothetical protein